MKVTRRIGAKVITSFLSFIVFFIPALIPSMSVYHYWKDPVMQCIILVCGLAFVYTLMVDKFHQINYNESELANTYLVNIKTKRIKINYDNISKLTFISKNLKTIFTTSGPDFCLIVFEKGESELYYPNSFRDGQIIMDLQLFKWRSIIDFLVFLGGKRPDLKDAANNIIAEICRIHNVENLYWI